MYYESKLHEEWRALYEVAKVNMRTCKSKSNISLIEVAAQHPLINGLYPNEEYEKRLRLGIELYSRLTESGLTVYFYTPGSLHMKDGIRDIVSLSSAGRNFLIEHGIPSTVVYADDANVKYKGDAGVYNSSDECYVATKLFEDLGARELHCVCSSAQVMRKALSYIRFGYIPYMHTVSCDVMYHNYVEEVFKFIPILLEDTSALQSSSTVTEKIYASRRPQ